jgi:hypothetical protein
MSSAQGSNSERRQFVRIKKNYIIRFSDSSNPSLKFEISQVENISKGGMCFTSTMNIAAGTNLTIELRTPYIADTIFLEGQILNSQERVKGLIYANRLSFKNFSPQAKDILEKIEKYNLDKIDKQ